MLITLSLISCAVSLAAPFQVISVDGDLHLGQLSRVQIASPVGGPEPQVSVSAGQLTPLNSSEDTGVWTYLFSPPSESGEVRFTVVGPGEVTQQRALTVSPPPPPLWETSVRVNASVDAKEVRLLIHSKEPISIDALTAQVGEGTVLGFSHEGDDVVLRLRPGEGAFPRVIPVLIGDRRSDSAPRMVRVHLWSRPRVALQTEPGAQVRLTVSGREYGPFFANEDGIVAGTVVQYPGELEATVVVSDAIGNESVSRFPLGVGRSASLVALPQYTSFRRSVGASVYLYALHGDGHAWQGSPPSCRIAGQPDPQLVSIRPGLWSFAARVSRPSARAYCSLGRAAEVVVPVRGPLGVTRIDLKVFPTEMSGQFPIAEVQASARDAFDERVHSEGLEVFSERGTVRSIAVDDGSFRGEYLGADAVKSGADRILAHYRAPLGEGPPVGLEVFYGMTNSGGAVLYGRALNETGHPIKGVGLSFSVGSERLFAETGATGWASVRVKVSESELTQVKMWTAHRSVSRLFLTRQAASGGPDFPDLVVRQPVSFLAGRVARFHIEVSPPVLFTGPNAVAMVTIQAVDRAGIPVLDAPVSVEVSEGSVSVLDVNARGETVVEYHPPPGESARTIQLVAVADARRSPPITLRIEPRPLESLALGVAVGGITDFGLVRSPAVDLNLALRAFSLSERFRARLLWDIGVSWHRVAPSVSGTVSVSAPVVVPMRVGWVARRESGGRALWAGGGVVVAPLLSQLQVGDSRLKGWAVGLGGTVVMGIGRRFGPGELTCEARWTGVSPVSGEDFFPSGVGGLSTLVGFRVVY